MLGTKLSAALAVAFVMAGAAPESPDSSVGRPAPRFRLKTLNPGLSKVRSFALQHFVGKRPKEAKKAVVLSFSASYCAPCKKELAELKTVEAQLARAGVQLAVVVVDTEKEGIETMRALTVDEIGLTSPVLSDRFGVVGRRYRAETLPTTVVVGPKGQIEWVSVGYRKETIDKLFQTLAIERVRAKAAPVKASQAASTEG